MNQVSLIGRLIKNPELRYTTNAKANCTFMLAVERALSKKQKDEARDKGYPTADFIRIVVWGKIGEVAAKYLVKGCRCAVTGSIQTGSYEKDGQKVYVTDVLASNVDIIDFASDISTQSSTQSSTQFTQCEDDFQVVQNYGDIPF